MTLGVYQGGCAAKQSDTNPPPSARLSLMTPELEAKIPQIQAICARYPVARLSAFGSAVTGGFEAGKSDIDLLVKMDDVPTLVYGNAYFGLLREFEELFKRPIDLVTEPSLTNPYIKKSVEATKVLIYGQH